MLVLAEGPRLPHGRLMVACGRSLCCVGRADTLLRKRILRLDSLGITWIDNLEVFNLHELYLQVGCCPCGRHRT